MSTDNAKIRAQQLEQQQLLRQRRLEQEAEERREKEENARDSAVFLGNGGGGFMDSIMKMLKTLLSTIGLGSIFAVGKAASGGGFFSSLSEGFSDFSDGLSGRGDTPLAPRGSKPHRSIGTAIAAPLRSGWNGVLDLIGQGESRGDYNIAYGSKKANFTGMTIDEVQKWQRDYVNSGSRSSAVGKYQIIQDTLAGLKKDMGLTGKEKFDEQMQDNMARRLLQQAGVDQYTAGNMTTGQIINRIAGVWAAVKTTNGKGAYDDQHGGNLNRGSLGNASMAAVLEQARTQEISASRTSVAAMAVPDKTPSKAPDVNSAMTKVAVAAVPSPAPAPAPQVVASVNKATEEHSWASNAVRNMINGVKTFTYGEEDPKAPKPTVVASTKPDRAMRDGLTLGLNG